MSKSKKNRKSQIQSDEIELASEPANQAVYQEISAEATEILPDSEEANEIIQQLSSEADLEDLNNEELLSEDMDLQSDVSIFTSEEEASEGFLPEVADEALMAAETSADADVELKGTELDNYESAQIEELEFIEEEQIESIIESVLFASDRPVSMNSLKMLFQGTNVKTDKIRRILDSLAVEYAGGRRGITLEEVTGGYQLRTKMDNMEFLRRTLKTRPFKLSGPALETLAIVAYKQPLIKHEIDEIRGVESGHLLRALMEKGLVNFEGKSDLPGRPMQYGTTRKFLEIFGLRSIKELPTLSQIDELLPEGIGEEEDDKEKQSLSDITSAMAESISSNYSQGEEELMKIQGQLEEIATTTQFFEEEKKREQARRQQEKAQGIREALLVNEKVPTRDLNWLKKYDEAIAAGHSMLEVEWPFQKKKVVASSLIGDSNDQQQVEAAIAEFESDEQTDAAKLDSNEEQNMTEEELQMAELESAEIEAELADEAAENDELPFYGEADEIDEKNEVEV